MCQNGVFGLGMRTGQSWRRLPALLTVQSGSSLNAWEIKGQTWYVMPSSAEYQEKGNDGLSVPGGLTSCSTAYLLGLMDLKQKEKGVRIFSSGKNVVHLFKNGHCIRPC